MSKKREGKGGKAAAKGALVPKLRFSEFCDESAWVVSYGNKLFDQINNRQATPGLPILAITQEHGAIPRDAIDYHVSVTGKSVETYKEVQPDDFIISLRSFQGGIEFSEYHGVCSPAYVILRKRTELSEVFFKYLFKSHRFIQQLTKNLEGLRDGKMISYRQFSEQLLPNPTFDEQQKIADCLSSIDELISAEAQKLDTLNVHKKGLMQQLFPAEGETVPQLRFPEFRDAGEWKTTTIGQVATYENGKAHEQDIAESGKFIVVNSKFISTDGEIRKFTNAAFCIATKEDILMVLSDVPNGRAIAKCFLVDTDNVYTVNQRICKITSFNAVSKMLFYVLNRSAYFLAFDDGVKQTNLKKDDVLDCPIVLPKDLNEQQKIASCLSSIDYLITTQTQKLATLKTHKKGLMQQLFPSLDEVQK